VTILIHGLLLGFVNINIGKRQKRKKNKIYDMLDISELDPNKILVASQDDIAEKIIETEESVNEVNIDLNGVEFPKFPERRIKNKLRYPDEARDNNIEAIVLLQLFIDHRGNIRDITVISDPGYGFAEEAVRAFAGIKCKPATKDGIPISITIRKKVRFKLR
jgi:TonB family protein